MAEQDVAGTHENLLDVVIERMHKAGKSILISRLVYVARLSRRQASADTLRGLHAKLVDKYFQEGEVTGLLLCFPSCMVHLLEGRTSVLMSILRDTLAAGPATHLMAEARVVSSTEDIPVRCFSGYYTAFANSNSSMDSQEAADTTTILKQATDLCSFMRRVGPSLLGLSEGDLRKRLHGIEAHYEDMPAPELVLSLVPADDAPTLEEYLELFDAPVNIDLDSERVWPMPSSVLA